VTSARCEVCRREGAQRDYAPDIEGAPAYPRGELCLNCTLAVHQVEARIVTFRRVLAYVKKYARATPTPKD
jgi:hypothetical protein